MRKQYFQDKGFIKKTLFFIIVFLFHMLSMVNLNAQGFDFSIQASYAKFDIDISRKVVLTPKNYNNGFELGPIVSFRPKNTLFAFNAGMLYNAMYYEKYNLNFVSIPVGLNIEIGKKAGVFLGFGIKFWYLLKVPEEFLLYYPEEYMSRFLYSYTAQIGVFFIVNKLRFQLCPQIESFQTSLYYHLRSPAPGHCGKYYYYLNMVSYNVTVSFCVW